MASALAVTAFSLLALLPAGGAGSGAGACLRLPGAKVVDNTSETVIVRVRGPRSYYGCLKRRGRPIRIDRRNPELVSVVYPPAGRYVVALSYDGVKKFPGRTAARRWLILTDLRTGAEYRVFKNFFFDDCCGGIFNVMVRDTGSVVFETDYGKSPSSAVRSHADAR